VRVGGQALEFKGAAPCSRQTFPRGLVCVGRAPPTPRAARLAKASRGSLDPEEVWVVFEPKAATGPIPHPVFEQVAQAFEDTGNALISDKVFIYEAPSLGAAHCLARRVVNILRSSHYRRSQS